MATITTTKLVLLVCVFALLPLAMEMMPLQPESAGTTCGVLILLVYTLWENYYFFYCKIAILRSRHMMHFGFIIRLVCWFGWLRGVSFGQLELSNTLTGSATFPALGITCIGNLAVFYNSILRGRLELEIGAKDALATLTDQNSMKIIKCSFGLTTCTELRRCSVLMLSSLSDETRSSLMKQFVEYMSNVYGVHTVLLDYLNAGCAVLVEPCGCSECKCIVFDTVEEIVLMLVHRMPGTVKRLPDSVSLLPSLGCLKKGCHGCNQGLLYVENDRLIEGDPQVESPAAVCEILDRIYIPSIEKERTCICIPLHQKSDDDWTEGLIRFFKRPGVTTASAALENYMAGAGQCLAIEEYNISSLFIVPRLTEVLINLVLTFWFKVDGFSSALVARRALKDYLVDKASGFYAHLFLTRAIVKSDATNTNVCQVLFFRSALLTVRPLNHLIGFVNVGCSISWIVLVALEGGANNWYHTQSVSPSEVRVAVIMAAIGTALTMDCFDFILYLRNRQRPGRRNLELYHFRRKTLMICAIIVLEILCAVSGSAVAIVLGIKVFGPWLYSALQCLVWVKWGIGSYLLEHYRSPEYGISSPHGSGGLYIYSSAFLLNAILAGVRAKWEY